MSTVIHRTSIKLANREYRRFMDNSGYRVPMVLGHGMGNAVKIWGRAFARPAGFCRVIAFDLPGFGEASLPDATYDSPFFAAKIVALLDTFGIRCAVLVGNWLGVSAVLHVSATAPGRIMRAVFAAPGGFGRQVRWTLLLQRKPNRTLRNRQPNIRIAYNQ